MNCTRMISVISSTLILSLEYQRHRGITLRQPTTTATGTCSPRQVDRANKLLIS